MEWLKLHNMQVDEVVSDEGISGGVSYNDRSLGRVLIPKLQAGDLLIVSEISRLSRSMYDLSKLINDELRPRKVRLIIVSMGIDLDCNKMTAIDQLILSNFSFAAQLEKELIMSRTKSAIDKRREWLDENGGWTSKSGRWTTGFGRPDVPKEHMLKMREASAERRRGKRDSRPGYRTALATAIDLRKRGETLESIRDTLNAMISETTNEQDKRFNPTPPRGGKWSKGQVSRMLNNS